MNTNNAIFNRQGGQFFARRAPEKGDVSLFLQERELLRAGQSEIDAGNWGEEWFNTHIGPPARMRQVFMDRILECGPRKLHLLYLHFKSSGLKKALELVSIRRGGDGRGN